MTLFLLITFFQGAKKGTLPKSKATNPTRGDFSMQNVQKVAAKVGSLASKSDSDTSMLDESQDDYFSDVSDEV